MTVALDAEAHHGAGANAKRSPNGRSALPGTRPGVASSGQPLRAGHRVAGGLKRRGGSDRHGQQKAARTGLGKVRGWSSYAFTRGLTNRHAAPIERTHARVSRDKGLRELSCGGLYCSVSRNCRACGLFEVRSSCEQSCRCREGGRSLCR